MKFKQLMIYMLLLTSIFALSACNKEENPSENETPAVTEDEKTEGENHVCSFDKEVADKKYLVKEATCGNPSIYVKSCSCGEKGTEKFEYGDPIDHDFVFSSATKPTCTEDGQSIYKCSMCNTLKHEDGEEKTGHSYTADYNWKNDTCVVILTCKNDNSHVVKKDMEVTTELVEEATCSKEGVNKHTATLTFEGVTYTDSNEEKLAKTKHTFENRVCSVCSEKEYSVGLAFELSEDGTSYEVVGLGECADTNVWIPYTHEGLPVTKIKSYAFLNCTNITEIIVPNSVLMIEVAAFMGCTSLESLSIPFVGMEKMEEINQEGTHLFGIIFGNSSFDNSTEIFQYYTPTESQTEKSRIFYIPNSLRNVTITGGTFKGAEFYNCSMLTNVVVDNEMTSLPKSSFYGCEKLESIELPDTIESFGNYVFGMCESLKSITLPENLESIDYMAFTFCEKLETVEFNENLKRINGSFNYCQSLTSVTLPEGLTTIGDYSFEDCFKLAEVNLPSTLEFVGERAFASCAIEKIVLPESVKTVKYEAFRNCESLKECVISDNAEISGNIFVGCTSLEYISLPYIETFKDHLDQDYSYLSFYFGGQNASWNYSSIPATLTHVRIGSGVIPTNTFLDAKINTVTFGNGVTAMNDNEFVLISSLSSIYYEGSVSEWLNVELPKGTPGFNGKQFFFYDENNEFVETTDIVIEDGVESIGKFAFSGNTSLVNLTLPNSLTSIGHGAFADCVSLENVYYNGTFEEWCEIEFETYNSNPMYNAKHFFILVDGEYQEVTEIVIPETVKEIKYQFVGMKNVTSITIPNTVTSIEFYAFAHCESLKEITIPESVETIGHSALINCFALEKVTLPFVGKSIKTANDTEQFPLGYIFGRDFDYTENMNSANQYFYNSSTSTLSNQYYNFPINLWSVTITGGNILYGAFYNCNFLTYIKIGDNVETIVAGALHNCSKLKELSLPFVGAKKTTATDDNQYPFVYIFQKTKNETIYSGYTAVSSNYISVYGETAPTRKDMVGYVPDSLKYVTITGGNIGYGAFHGCSKLESISLREGVTGIGDRAFRGCSSLLTLMIPNTVKTTEMNTFLQCTQLNTLIFIGDAVEYKTLSYTAGFTSGSINGFNVYIYSETEPTDTKYTYWHWDENHKFKIWQ